MSERSRRRLFAQRNIEHDDPPATDSGPRPPPLPPHIEPTLRPPVRGLASWDEIQPFESLPEITSLRRRREASSDDDDDDDESRSAPRIDDGQRWNLRKRRRLDTSARPGICPPIKYNYYGQVVPGRLKMQLISCDGGEHTDPRYPHIDLGPHNVLKADKSVFCSARGSAAIVLRHADDTPFSLTQISIVAPEHGFTAPVKQGVVYIGMTIDALTSYLTKAQDLANPPPYSRYAELPSEDAEALSFTEALAEIDMTYVNIRTDRLDFLGFEPPSLADDTYTQLFNRLQSRRRTGESHFMFMDRIRRDEHLGPILSELLYRIRRYSRPDESLADTHRRFYVQRDPGSVSSVEPEPIPGTVQAMLASDSDVGPEDVSSPEVLDYRLQRMQLLQRRQEHLRWRDRRLNRSLPLTNDFARATARPDFPSAELRTPTNASTHDEASQRANETAVRQSTAADVTCARFSIGETANRISIKFNVPVAGRFILLKLTAAPYASNVDVQTIIAMGYAGPRFFPAMEPR